MKNVKAKRVEAEALALVFALGVAPLVGHAAELKPGPIAGNTVYLGKARGYAFCEFEVVMGTPPNLVVQIYNTSGQQECSPAQFNPIDPRALAKKLGADAVVRHVLQLHPLDQRYSI